MTKLFVYGTLLEQGKEITHVLPGYMMYHINGGSFDFPMITPYPWDDKQPLIAGSVVEVDDESLAKLDIYEGVNRGLFSRVKAIAYENVNKAVREPVEVQVYVGGPALVYKLIPSGIWSDRQET